MEDIGDIYNPRPASQPGRTARPTFPPVKKAGPDGEANLTGTPAAVRYGHVGVDDQATSCRGVSAREGEAVEDIGDIYNPRPASQPGRTARPTFTAEKKAGPHGEAK